ncbi:NAC domain-containing protein 60-like isoform X1 [Cynara cardunculus var. scolymus]|uniref:NAC domain-containing protein 60-like isoform X1 n=1 Tax=Cynara cardunculus var. scolymus TaxID=59895 RepID=UPI000D630731|nr:NAC domain-containing protein 60-like isoform X1 [Cynara cardunculus var. scolymus]
MSAKEVDGGGGDWSMKDIVAVDGGYEAAATTTTPANDAERTRDMQLQLSIAKSSSVFPGFRFSPTDNELISYYLKKKLQGSDNCVDIIPEVDFCRHEPWDLPALSIVRSDNEWFFFSARGKKYPNGSQSKRATQSGYWKATGKERNVKSGAVTIGTKRTLVFHTGRAPKGERTEWIMHEYCMTDTTQESLVVCRLRRNSDFRLNESSRGSSDQRNLSAADNGNSGTNEYANTQIEWFDEANAVKTCSKESTSSYRSHSFEQNDSGSESERQLIHESPNGSSSQLKECDNEDDWFADIINDDIIKLDESASNSFTFHGVLSGNLPLLVHDPTKCNQQETISAHEQGTAFRRIRLRQQKGQTQDVNPDGDQDQKSSGCVISVLAGATNNVARFRSALVFLCLLMLFVFWQRDHLPSYSKQHLGINLKRQLRYWLHKAAEYI